MADAQQIGNRSGGTMTRRRRSAIALGVLVLAGLGAALVYLNIFIFVLCCGARGIDVSHHQGKIDWNAVAHDGTTFAFIKATEGGDFVDPNFATNWQGARSAGLKAGGYHYFTPCRSGAEQAQNLIATLPREKGMLPPSVDAEHMEPCTTGATVDMAREIAAFVDAVSAHYDCAPVIYTTSEFENAFLRGHFASEPFWVRSLLLPPTIRTASWKFWQVHNAGSRDGITGPVDINLFRGSASDLENYVTAARCGL